MVFLARAAVLSGKSRALAAALVTAATSARSLTVFCGGWVRSPFALSPETVCDGLTRLEAAGLADEGVSLGKGSGIRPSYTGEPLGESAAPTPVAVAPAVITTTPRQVGDAHRAARTWPA